MRATSINARPVHRHTGLVGFFLVALLLPSVPATASGLVIHEPMPLSRHAHAGTLGGKACALPRLSIRTDNPLVVSTGVGSDAGIAFAPVENSWASVATSHSNADMNRAVDHLFSPPDHVNIYATQTSDDRHGHFEGTSSPNETVAALEIVIH